MSGGLRWTSAVNRRAEPAGCFSFSSEAWAKRDVLEGAGQGLLQDADADGRPCQGRVEVAGEVVRAPASSGR
ncbi:hypothetical protein ADK53_32885 [Streptomyces sp. WM6373]|nr:hypothetical protein ADK53_32885 [Streptomyces sp. WM6373]